MHKHSRNDKYVKIYTWLIYICITTSCSIHNKIVIHQTFWLLYSSPLQWHWETCWEVYTAIMKLLQVDWQEEKQIWQQSTELDRTAFHYTGWGMSGGSDRGALYRGLESSVSVDWSGSWQMCHASSVCYWHARVCVHSCCILPSLVPRPRGRRKTVWYRLFAHAR